MLCAFPWVAAKDDFLFSFFYAEFSIVINPCTADHEY